MTEHVHLWEIDVDSKNGLFCPECGRGVSLPPSILRFAANMQAKLEDVREKHPAYDVSDRNFPWGEIPESEYRAYRVHLAKEFDEWANALPVGGAIRIDLSKIHLPPDREERSELIDIANMCYILVMNALAVND